MYNKIYSNKFKLKAIESVNNGELIKDVADKMGCSITSITNWIKLYEEDNKIFNNISIEGSDEELSVKITIMKGKECLKFIYKLNQKNNADFIEKCIEEIKGEVIRRKYI